MQELIRIGFGILIILSGIPVGDFLAKITREELKSGQKWFRIIIFLGMIWSLISLIIQNDIMLFSALFVIIVTSRSIK